MRNARMAALILGVAVCFALLPLLPLRGRNNHDTETTHKISESAEKAAEQRTSAAAARADRKRRRHVAGTRALDQEFSRVGGPLSRHIAETAARLWKLDRTLIDSDIAAPPPRMRGCSRHAKYCSFGDFKRERRKTEDPEAGDDPSSVINVPGTFRPLPNSPPCCAWAQLVWMLANVSDPLSAGMPPRGAVTGRLRATNNPDSFWLSRGTAIGVRRTGEILPWDRDTDINIQGRGTQVALYDRDRWTYAFWASLVGWYDHTKFVFFDGEFDWGRPVCREENAIELRDSVYTDIYFGSVMFAIGTDGVSLR
jgi:LicD family